MKIILTMILATQISRLTPLFLTRFRLSRRFEAWLAHVPIAVLTALVVPELISQEHSGVSINEPFAIGAAICLVAGFKTRNLLFTTFVGVVSVALIRYFNLR